MKLCYLKFKNWILLSLMGALGLNSCNSSKEMKRDPKEPRRPRNEIMLLYGVYTTDFNQNTQSAKEQEPIEEAVEQEPVLDDQRPLLYGVPTVEFRLTGRVVDEKGVPIPSAQVVLLDDNFDIEHMEGVNLEYWAEYLQRSADTTDAQGEFSVRTRATPFHHSKHVLVRDIDGTKNGTFKDKIVEVKFSEVKAAPLGSVGSAEMDTTIKVNKD